MARFRACSEGLYVITKIFNYYYNLLRFYHLQDFFHRLSLRLCLLQGARGIHGDDVDELRHTNNREIIGACLPVVG